MEIQHYRFEEVESGENFLVGAETKAEAFRIAEEVEFEIMKNYKIKTKLVFFGCIPEWEAEACGYDEY